jgi:hypothetical protein
VTVTVTNRRGGLCTLHLRPTLLGRVCLLHDMMGTFIEMSEGQRIAVSAWVFELCTWLSRLLVRGQPASVKEA